MRLSREEREELIDVIENITTTEYGEGISQLVKELEELIDFDDSKILDKAKLIEVLDYIREDTEDLLSSVNNALSILGED